MPKRCRYAFVSLMAAFALLLFAFRSTSSGQTVWDVSSESRRTEFLNALHQKGNPAVVDVGSSLAIKLSDGRILTLRSVDQTWIANFRSRIVYIEVISAPLSKAEAVLYAEEVSKFFKLDSREVSIWDQCPQFTGSSAVPFRCHDDYSAAEHHAIEIRTASLTSTSWQVVFTIGWAN